jgi:transposase
MAYMTLLTGPERRRRWSQEERCRILSAAFSPGAVVTAVARENDISTALIYKWRQLARREAGGVAFAPAVLAREPATRSPGLDAAAITVMLAGGTRVRIGAGASASLVTATLRALR